MTKYAKIELEVTMDEAARILSTIVRSSCYEDIQTNYKNGELTIVIMEDAWEYSSVQKLVGFCLLKYKEDWIFGEFGA